jgi:restriction system protein
MFINNEQLILMNMRRLKPVPLDTVSTGGFTKEARYEADRAVVPLTLITLPRLRELLLQHYEQLDPAARALVPLQRLYWPVE